MAVVWLDEPQDHDYPAAYSYLTLILRPRLAEQVVEKLRDPNRHDRRWKAKDLLRAARVPCLPRSDPHVATDLQKIVRGKALAPVLLVRGTLDRPLVIADGYHRVCAAYHTDENAEVPGRICSLEF